MNKQLVKTFWLLLLSFVTGVAMAQGEFKSFEYQGEDGQKRPYILYVPKNLEQGKKHPLVVYLHGAVSATTLRINPLESAQKSPLVKLADEGGYYVLFPYGQKGATWFEPNGIKMVLAEIDKIKQEVAVNEDKIFLSGFSDGGSGTLYFATTQSSPFAGFISLNGSLSVAATIGKSPVYLENLNHKPLYIVNTQSDMLYPVRLMQPTIEKIKEYHSDVVFRSPEGNHEMSYFPTIAAEVKAFIDNHQRQPITKISFESADDFSNKFAWLKITKLNPAETAKEWHTPYELKMVNDKASFGMILDASYTGKGMKVSSFNKKGSAAEKMGVQAGDIILKMEDTELDHRYAAFNYLSTKKAGDKTTLTVERNSQIFTLSGQFPEGYEYQVFAKQPISGKVRAEVNENRLLIETSRVSELEIDFSLLPFKADSMIELELNGKIQQVKPENMQTFTIQ
ncbi:Poly(3-hydroxybutyrate) depolymerase [Pasteurella multocida]|nr:Poly(3-hydroxybutyrate) depolymerase [Pasteurella multocida]